MNNPHTAGSRPALNQLRGVMLHVPKYQFHGLARLARDAGLDRTTVSRFANCRHMPSFRTVAKVVSALEEALSRVLDPRDVMGIDGVFRRTPCQITGCPGCLPDEAFTEEGIRKQAFLGVEPGAWTAWNLMAGKEER